MIGKHDTEERCFYCASDEEMSAAISGSRPHPTIHMNVPLSACPFEEQHHPVAVDTNGNGGNR